MSSAQLSFMGGTATGSASRATTRGQSLRPVAVRLFRDNQSRRRPGTGGTHEQGAVNGSRSRDGMVAARGRRSSSFWGGLCGRGGLRQLRHPARSGDLIPWRAEHPCVWAPGRQAARQSGGLLVHQSPSFCLGRPSASRPLRPRAIVACLKVGDCLVASIRIRARVTSSRAGSVYSGWGGRHFRGFW